MPRFLKVRRAKEVLCILGLVISTMFLNVNIGVAQGRGENAVLSEELDHEHEPFFFDSSMDDSDENRLNSEELEEEIPDADQNGWTKAVDKREKVILVLSPPAFDVPLRRWIAYRQEQGRKILLMPLANISEDGTVDQGVLLRPIASPDEIRAKIRKAAKKYHVDAILLVGDGAPTENAPYGWRDVVPAPRVPARVVQVFGSEDLLASDAFYADLDGDEIPDVPIGRLPVETADELDNCVEKIIRYETASPAGNWSRCINVVAGPNGLDLRAIGSEPGSVPVGETPLNGISSLVTSIVDRLARKLFSDYLPQEFNLSLTQFSPQSVFCPYPEDFGDAVLERFNEGSLFWIYLGHGRVVGLDRYFAPSGRDYGVLEMEDCSSINCDGHAPIALFFACYTGAYDASVKCLAEELFLQKNGPVAVVGASRRTAPYGMCYFGSALMESAFGYDYVDDDFNKGPKTLGELYYNAQRRTLDDLDDDESLEEELVFTSETTESGASESVLSDSETDSDPLSPGSQLKWINERLEKSLVDAEKIRRKNASFRKTIDQAAAILDPTANRLDDQLRDHIAEFNLFGDPLLKVKFPTRVSIDAPEIAYSMEEVELTGKLPVDEGEEAIVQGELLLADFRPNISKPKRDRVFRESEENRREFNDVYHKANNFVVDAIRTKTKGGQFKVRIRIPANYSGESIVRIAAVQGDRYFIGSKRILVRPKTVRQTN